MVIHLIQDELGAVDDTACEWIAMRLELQPINIKELITFYPMLREKPWGRKHVRVCRTLPCALRGSYATCKTFEKKLGVKEGHVREDGEYSLEFMECLADCGQGPVVIVDEKTYENIDGERAENFAELLLDGNLNKSLISQATRIPEPTAIRFLNYFHESAIAQGKKNYFKECGQSRLFEPNQLLFA